MAAGNGLFSGGIFAPIDIGAIRRKRREGLLGMALHNARTPQERLGGTLGTVLGDTIGKAVGGEPSEITRAKAIKDVQGKLAATGLEPGKDPEYFRVASGLLSQAGFPDLAQQTKLQAAQFQKAYGETPKVSKRTMTVRGGDNPQARALEKRGVYIPEGETYEIQMEGGSVVDVNRLGTSTSITNNVGGETDPLTEELGKVRAKRIEHRIEAGNVASGMVQTLADLEDIVADPGFQSGKVQPLVTTLQGVADSVGFDLSGAASKLGIDLGNLSTKEEFARLSDVLTTEVFAKFKGNLNDREVKIAQNAVTQLGKSPEANIRAIASLMASSQLAQETGNRALRIDSSEGLANLEDDVQKRGTKRFRELRDQILERLNARKGEKTQPTIRKEDALGALPEGASLGQWTSDGWAVIQNGQIIGHIKE